MTNDELFALEHLTDEELHDMQVTIEELLKTRKALKKTYEKQLKDLLNEIETCGFKAYNNREPILPHAIQVLS